MFSSQPILQLHDDMSRINIVYTKAFGKSYIAGTTNSLPMELGN